MSRVGTGKQQQRNYSSNAQGVMEQNNNHLSLEEELDQQIKKSDLLDKDRYNFYLKAEDTKQKNNQIIEQMKKENGMLKKLRDDLQKVKKSSTQNMNKTSGSNMMGQEGRDEKYWRRKLDEAQHITKNQQTKLENLQDKLNEVTDNKFGLHDESQLMRNIRILENRLDKVMIKFNEAQSIKKTYEQIVKRLKEERVGYDNQLAAIERSLKGKERDFEELLLLAHDATHAKELAEAELKKYEHKKASVRELRNTYLDEKRKAIEGREEVMSRMEKREQDNQNHHNNDQQNKVNNNNNMAVMQNLNQDQHLSQDHNMNKMKLKEFDDAFRKLYEATGVTDVNEIIQKFTTQSDTRKQLSDLKQEYSDKSEQLEKELMKLKEELNLLKYGQFETVNRKQTDDTELIVNTAIQECERFRLKYERISKVLVNVKSGIEHLVEKTDFFRLEGRNNQYVSDETLNECLTQTIDKMKLIFQVVKNDPSYKEDEYKHDGKYIPYNKIPFNLNIFDKNAKIESLQKNIRVPLMNKDDDDEISDVDFDNQVNEDNNKMKQKIELKNKQEKILKKK